MDYRADFESNTYEEIELPEHVLKGMRMFMAELGLAQYADHADLRAVSLVGVPLEGIRWSSATTLWPPEWEEQIRAESVETDDGNFVICGKGRRFAPATV